MRSWWAEAGQMRYCQKRPASTCSDTSLQKESTRGRSNQEKNGQTCLCTEKKGQAAHAGACRQAVSHPPQGLHTSTLHRAAGPWPVCAHWMKVEGLILSWRRATKAFEEGGQKDRGHLVKASAAVCGLRSQCGFTPLCTTQSALTLGIAF